MSAELFAVAGHAVTPLGLLALAGAAVALVVGVLPLLTDELLRESLFFLLFCLAVALWLTGFGLMYGAPDEARALRWMRFAYLGVPLIPATLYTVAVHSLEVAEERRRALAALWVGAAVFVLVITGSDVVVQGLHRYPWGWYPAYTPAGLAFVGFVATGLGASVGEYAIRREEATRVRERRRVERFYLAFGLGSLAMLDFLPCYGVWMYPPGNLVVPIMLVSIGHTIRHYHLAELTPGFAAEHILAMMTEPVLVLDRRGEIQVANVAATSILGHDREDLMGRPLQTLGRAGPGDGDPWVGMQSGAVVRNRKMVLRTREGEPVEAAVSAAPVADRRGRRVGTVVVIRDLREETALRERAFQDALTGLPNRVLFRDRLEQLLRMQARRPERGLAVLYLDLDGFKAINDTLGHAAGDRVLERTAERLNGVIRAGDTAARLGGDEFAVVLGDLGADTAEKEARIVAERALEAITEPVELEEESVDLGVSIGVAVCAGGSVEADELTRRADEAMYRGKVAPGSAIVIYRPEAEEAPTRRRETGRANPARDREDGTM